MARPNNDAIFTSVMACKCITTVICIAVLAGIAGGCKIGIWPLLSNYLIKDGVSNTLVYPLENDCFQTSDITVKSSTESNLDVLEFTKERKSYVDFNIQSGNLNELSISMFVDASSGNGTLFHYKSSYPSQNINEIKITMLNYRISVVYCYNYDCNFEGFFDILTIDPDDAQFIKLYRVKDGTLNINVRKDERYKEHHKDIEFNMVGSVRIGGSIDSDIGDFLGKLHCVTIGKEFDAKKAIEECAGYSSDRICSGVIAWYVWPLNERSLGYEAKSHTEPTSSTSLSSTTSEPIAGLTEPSTTVFTALTCIQTEVTFAYDRCKRFSIAMFIYPQLKSRRNSDTVLQITLPTGCYSGLELQVRYTTFSATLTTGTNKVQIENSLPDTTTDWHFIAVQVNWYWKEFTLIVDNQYQSETILESLPASYSSGKLKLKVGGDFEGRMACLAVLNTPLSENTASDVLKSFCNQESVYDAPVPDDPKPVKLWPLNKNSEGYEKFGNIGITDPPSNLCWRFNKANEINLLDSEAVQFYGSDKFSLTITPVNNNATDLFSFGFLFKTKTGVSGNLLEVYFDSTDGSVVSYQLRIFINETVMDIVIQDSTTTTCSSLSNLALQFNQWVSVAVEGDSLGNYKVYIDDDAYNFPSGCGKIVQMKFNKFVLGEGVDGLNGFLGEIRCLTIFDKNLIPAKSRDSLTKACSSSSDFKKPVTGNTAVKTDKFWRLDKMNSPSDKQVHDMSLLATNQSLYFDGSSRLHVLMDALLPNDDTSLGFFFRPAQNSKGVLVQINPLNVTSGIQISIDQDVFSVVFNNQECETMTFNQVAPNRWHWFFLIRVMECKTLIAVLDGEIQYGESACFTAVETLNLRLGGEVNTFNNFRGDLSCLTVFDSALHPDISQQSMINSCDDPSAGYGYTVDGEEYEDDNLLTQTKYQAIATDSIPRDTTDVLKTIYVYSISSCAGACTKTRYCRSFIITATGEQSMKSCTLLSFMTRIGLTYRAGSDYFGMLYSISSNHSS